MFCPKCGNQLPDGSKFCGVCGQRLINKTNDTIIAPAASHKIRTTEEKNKSKKHKKINGKIIIAVVMIAVIIASATVGAMILLEENNALVYVSKGTYKLITGFHDFNSVEIASSKTESYSENLLKFSPDGKYIYYFTKYDYDTESGMLCRAKYGKLKDDSSKNSNYIEIVDKNVFGKIDFAGSDYLIYKTNNGDLYCYDGKESFRIDKNVDYWEHDDSGRIIYTKDEEKNYDSVYGVNLDDPENIKVVVPTYHDYVFTDSFDNMVYTMEVNGKVNVYSANFEEKNQLIVEDIKNIWKGSGGKIFFITENEDKAELYGFVNDSGESSDENLRKELHDKDNALSLYTIYCHENGETKIIDNSVLNFFILDTYIVYNNISSVKEKIDFEDISSVNDIAELLEFQSDGENTILLKDGSIYNLSKDAAETIGQAYNDEYCTLYPFKDKVYMIEADKTLSLAYVTDGIVEDFKIIAEDADYIIESNSKIYFIANTYNADGATYGDFFHVKDEKVTVLERDVIVSAISIYEDGSYFAFKNYKSGVGCELVTFDSKGNNKNIADGVREYLRVDRSTLLYISDNDLYLYKNGQTQRISNEVDYIWCNNFMKAVEKHSESKRYYGGWDTIPADYLYDVIDSDTCVITSYIGESQKIKTPSKIDGYEVISIGTYAFSGTSVEDVIISDTVKNVEAYSFFGCNNLKSIKFGKNVEIIKTHAFYGCENLKEVKFNENLNTIHYYAFAYCSSIKTLDFPESVKTISSDAFQDCTELESINYPIGLTKILSCLDTENERYDFYTSPFDGCKKLKFVEIPEGVTVIPAFLFRWSVQLEEVVIPESVVTIERYAFNHCYGLTEVIIPDNVECIEEYAFWGSKNMKEITLSEALSYIGNNAFKECESLKRVYFRGSAPEVYSASSEEPSFVSDTAILYYINGKEGWTSPKWNGYNTTIWEI